MLYKLKGNLKDGVSFSFDKLKHVKSGEIGLVDIYIPGDEAPNEITFIFMPEELRGDSTYAITINLGQDINFVEDIQKNVIYKIKNILEERNYKPEYRFEVNNERCVSFEFNENDKLMRKIVDAIESSVFSPEKNREIYFYKEAPGRINICFDDFDSSYNKYITDVKEAIEAERNKLPPVIDINKFKFEKNNNKTRVYSPVKLIITHPGTKIFGIPNYTIIEPNKETIFESDKDTKLKEVLDMFVYSNLVDEPIFRFIVNKLPVYIKPMNVIYFRLIGLFDKLKLTFKGEGNDLNLKNVNVVIDFHEAKD